MRAVHRSVVFKAVLADMLHQRLQLRHFDHGAAAESIQGIIDEHAVADISPYRWITIIGRNPRVAERTRGRPPATTP